MIIDLSVNVVAGIILLLAGFLSRQALNRLRTRAMRRLWRGSITNGLTVALSARADPSSKSGSKLSFVEMRTLLSLVPTFERIRVEYDIIESFTRTANRVTDRHLLMLGGPLSNELCRTVLELLAPRLSITASYSSVPTLTVRGQRYQSRYSEDGSSIVETHGFVVRARSPFSSDPRLTVTLVMGLHGLGTAGAARLLTDERLARELYAQVSGDEFVAAVIVRPIGSEYAVRIEDAWILE